MHAIRRSLFEIMPTSQISISKMQICEHKAVSSGSFDRIMVTVKTKRLHCKEQGK